jgi:predicted protein tyrosine phosphatase
MTEANISWVTDQVATGGDFSHDPDKAQRQLLELLGMDIDLVIDCRIEANDQAIWDQTHVDYLHLPTNDSWGWRIPNEHFDRAVEAARPVLEGGGKVFVHCHMGINRGPSTALALLLDQSMPATAAFDLIREKRPQAGILYATDALRAHLTRRGGKWHRMATLRRHIDKVMPLEVRAGISRIIRDNHERDREELLGTS